MRFITVILIVSAFASSVGCRQKETRENTRQAAKADILVRCHFVGTTSLANSPDATNLTEIWSLPESKHLLDQTLKRLAHAPRTLYDAQITPIQDERGAALLRPMLDDLLRYESFLQARGPADKTAEWTLLVQLPAPRLQMWRASLAELMQVWKLGDPATNTVEGFASWEIKRNDPPTLVRCVEAGQWLVFGVGHDKLSGVGEAARRIKTAGRPIAVATNYWFETELNLPRLSAVLDLSSTIQWPHATWSVIGSGGNLRSNVRMVFPEPVTGPLDLWQVPTNMINEPLISFTAARGVSLWLRNCLMLQQLELTPPPNQLFFWAQGHVTFQSFVAFALKDAAVKLERAANRASSLIGTNWQGRSAAQIAWQTNTHEIAWKSVPYISPFLRPAQVNGQDFVVGGLFPATPSSNPPPAELLSQLSGQPKLVYYDWEITQARLSSWRVMAQLFAMIADKPQLTTNTAGLPWLVAVEPKLGNTITEITAASPAEWSLVRRSHIGFTGVELVALARWLESTRFPKLSFELPPDRPLKSAPKSPAAANPPSGPAQKPSRQ